MGKTDKTQPHRLQGTDPSRRWKNWCGCRMCTGYWERRWQQATLRTRQRQMLSILTKTGRQDLDEIDTDVPKTERWYFYGRKGTP